VELDVKPDLVCRIVKLPSRARVDLLIFIKVKTPKKTHVTDTVTLRGNRINFIVSTTALKAIKNPWVMLPAADYFKSASPRNPNVGGGRLPRISDVQFCGNRISFDRERGFKAMEIGSDLRLSNLPSILGNFFAGVSSPASMMKRSYDSPKGEECKELFSRCRSCST